MEKASAATTGQETFPGGMEVGLALKELRKSFQSGHDLAVILLGSMIIERQLIGLLRKRGWKDSHRMKPALEAALSHGLITPEEKGRLTHLRFLRNSYIHYYDPQHDLSLFRRALLAKTPPDDILRQDALAIIALAEAVSGREDKAMAEASGPSCRT